MLSVNLHAWERVCLLHNGSYTAVKEQANARNARALA